MEHHHAAARAMFHSQPEDEPFLVRHCSGSKCWRVWPDRGESDELLRLVDGLIRSPGFVSVPLGTTLLDRAATVATAAKLRAYDAVYGALSLSRDAPLVTLDNELATRLVAAYPDARVNTGCARREQGTVAVGTLT